MRNSATLHSLVDEVKVRARRSSASASIITNFTRRTSSRTSTSYCWHAVYAYGLYLDLAGFFGRVLRESPALGTNSAALCVALEAFVSSQINDELAYMSSRLSEGV
ncbi:hypothetical protein AMS68_007877 [Peltaster fructicola]|uniref:Uncharacterized protein n=1 Tax=Peltaster fructicola TaxID=286661 RepID=A0A6H0Y6X6_9PEZI|nr:hypothetical protein AMS68_007877 [Peltaster fructicola]